MADRSISELPAAGAVGATDLFVLQQANAAKKLTGQTLENWLLELAQGNGGIVSITKTSSSGTNPVVDTYTITYSNETTSTFTVTNGVKGDTGARTYVHIKYSAVEPDSDSDMGNTPDNWIGIATTTSSTAPAHYTSYSWFKIKGETGATGAAATITRQSVQYQASTSGTVIPTGTWTSSIPALTEGYYLWTRTIVTYNSGTTTTAYSVGYKGVNGTGAGDMTRLVYDPNGAVEASGGIAEYVSGIAANKADRDFSNVPNNTISKAKLVVGATNFQLLQLSTSRTMAASDNEKLLWISGSASSLTFTLPANDSSIPLNAECCLWNNSPNIATVAAGTGASINGMTSIPRYCVARIKKWSATGWSCEVSGVPQDGTVTTSKIADGVVTRAKFADDALYSPMKSVTTQAYSVVADDLGRTLRLVYNGAVSVTLSNSVLSALPLGAEIAFMRGYISGSNKSFSITVGSSWYLERPGELGSKGRTLTCSNAYELVAIKKVSGDEILATGNFD